MHPLPYTGPIRLVKMSALHREQGNIQDTDILCTLLQLVAEIKRDPLRCVKGKSQDYYSDELLIKCLFTCLCLITPLVMMTGGEEREPGVWQTVILELNRQASGYKLEKLRGLSLCVSLCVTLCVALCVYLRERCPGTTTQSEGKVQSYYHIVSGNGVQAPPHSLSERCPGSTGVLTLLK